MIELTRLNQQPFTINSDLIKSVENTPDTVITLINGEKFVVLENAETIVQRVVEFRRRVLDGLMFNGLSAPSELSRSREERQSERRRLQDSEEEE